MKNKLLVACLSVLLLLVGFSFEVPAYYNSETSASASPEFTQPRRKRKTIRRSKQRFVIHRKSGKVRRAICRDGSITLSRNRRGTCSRHGGVRRWLR